MGEQDNTLQLIDKGLLRKPWSIEPIEFITIGAEGPKLTAELVLSSRIVGGFFLKQADRLEDAIEQYKKWQILHSAGVPTSSFFRIARDSNKNIWMIMEDLSKNGNNWVVSANNNTILLSREYWEQIARIPKIKKQEILNQATELASTAGENGISFSNPLKKMNPLMITVSKDPLEVEVAIYAQDFGIDMDIVFPSPYLQQRNIIYTTGFLYEVLYLCPYQGLIKDGNL